MSSIALRNREAVYHAPAAIRDELDRRFIRLSDGGTTAPEEIRDSYPVDLSEDWSAVIIEAELPGFAKSEIRVSLNQKAVSITAQRRPRESNTIRHISERRLTRFNRCLLLPTTVDESRAEAMLRDGILVIRIPKAERLSEETVILSFSEFDWSK